MLKIKSYVKVNSLAEDVYKRQEEGNLSESEDENLFQIPASGDFSEYE